jgi:predicted TPR repeat methyltransferase
MLMKAVAVHKAGRIAEAKKIYERILKRRPEDPDALNFLGMLEYQRGEKRRSRALLEKSVCSAPRNPHAWLNLGNVRMAEGDTDEAAAAYEHATELAPDLWQAWLNRGMCLRRLSRFEEAVDCLKKAVILKPKDDVIYEWLGRMLYRAGRLEELKGFYSDWVAFNPDNPTARHMLAAATGEAPPERASDEYVRRTFDTFADTFDENLSVLDYRAPQLLAAALERYWHPTSDAGLPDVLDAGVGTGLSGPLLRDKAGRLVGVDLSGAMVEKARQRGLYDELVVAELCDFMRGRPAAFDVVLSADTLVYFGALEEAFAAAHTCLRSGGLLLFTVERWATDDPEARYCMQVHGRYAHAPAYVRAALAASGFRLAELGEAVLRSELGVDVGGLVAAAVR